MFLNKKQRLKYLGFHDHLFVIIGILLLGFSTLYIFNAGIAQLTAVELLITLVASLLFSAADWLVNRSILIFLRKRYPSLQNSVKRVSLLFVATMLMVILIDFIGIFVISMVVDQVKYVFWERAPSLVMIMFLTTMIMAIYEAIYFSVLLKKSVREEEQAKQTILQAELDALRNQVQPHFFFNSLNTLRDIIEQSPKEDARQFLDHLSVIYRYLLEAGNKHWITLEEELRFAEAYIKVQTERFGTNLKLNWNISSATKKQFIAPMSLQLLLENAIKHNVISRKKPLEIDVYSDGDRLLVKNHIQKKSTQFPSTKMGLSNIEKRYELLTDRAVEILNDGQCFRVALPLLSSENLKPNL